MKLMIASDIHGSAYYCRKLMEAFEKEKPDRLILLGDLLYHGPRNALPRDYNPQKVAAMLNSIKSRILCIQGNCDSEVDQVMLDFPVMNKTAWLIWNDKVLHLFHGHQLPEQAENIGAEDMILYGHTHIPDWHMDELDRIWLNPGSVSIPKQNSRPGYMILTDVQALWKSLAEEDLEEQSTDKTYHILNLR